MAFSAASDRRRAFDINGLDIADAEEAENRLQVRYGMVQGGGRALRVDATRGEHHINLLAGCEADRTTFRVFEGQPGTGDVVDPVFSDE